MMRDSGIYSQNLPWDTRLGPTRKVRQERKKVVVRYGVAKWRKVDWPVEAGAVHLCTRQLCDPHLHHAWVWRMGPWRLARGSHHQPAQP